MPDEPQHPMDPPLRAWAEGRRQAAGPPFELHPVDQAKLQEEVARTYGQPEMATAMRPAFSWRQLWPRLAFVTGVGTILFLAMLQLNPKPGGAPEMDLAQLDSKQSETLPEDSPRNRDEYTSRLEPALESVPEPGTSASDAVTFAPTTAREPEKAAAETSRADPNSQLMRSRYGLAGRDDASTTRSVDVPAPQPASYPAASRPASLDRPLSLAPAEAKIELTQASAYPRETGLTEVDPAKSQSFVPQQILRRNFNAPPNLALQSRFQLEQIGTQMRVVDEDGSVYEGPVIQAESRANQVSAAQIGGVSFEVIGTNRSQQVQVVFQGVLGTGTPARVQGLAILGNKDRVMVDAVQTAP